MYKTDHLTASCLPLLSSIHLGGCHVQRRSPYSIMFAIVVKESSWWLSCTRKITLQHHVCHCCQVFILVAVMYKEDHLTASCVPLLSSIHLGGCHVQGRPPCSIMFAVIYKEDHLTALCLPLLSSNHLGSCHIQGRSPYSIMFAIVVK